MNISSWFVNNIQDGKDDCGEYYVPSRTLKELHELLLKVVVADKNLAEELFPTQSGFFFGSTDYDEYYYEEIRRTIEILEEIFEEDNSESTFYYQSSW